MLLVKWFPYTILLLALIGSSFSLKCKSCEENKDDKGGQINCDKSKDCEAGADVCSKLVLVDKPSVFMTGCSKSKEAKCEYFPAVGECKEFTSSQFQQCMLENLKQMSRDMSSKEIMELATKPNTKLRMCLCSGDNCNSAFGPAPNLGFALGSATIIAVSWIGGYGALGI